jgi:glucoamylase
MPRNLPLGNGNMLVTFDHFYQIRDLYWPHVGQENHALGHPFRIGVWANDQFRWLDDSRWERSLRYLPETLVTDVGLIHSDLMIEKWPAQRIQPVEGELIWLVDAQAASW